MKFSRAFTIIELVFVIVVLGILATVALPKFGKTKEQADIAKGRADVATIRAAIVNERQTRLILGDSDYIDKLSTGVAGDPLFTGNGTETLLTYGITAGTSNGHWERVNDTTYRYRAAGVTVPFTYTVADGVFTCDTTAGTSGETCKKLVN